MVSIAGCNKKQETENNVINSLSEATQKSINAGTITAIRQSYSLLTSVEKQKLWDTKWSCILKNDEKILSKEQKQIIQAIQMFVDKKNNCRTD